MRHVGTIFVKEKKKLFYTPKMYVALDIQHALRMRHIFICGLCISITFFHIISSTARFSKISYRISVSIIIIIIIIIIVLPLTSYICCIQNYFVLYPDM
jgi:hypothetical protein